MNTTDTFMTGRRCTGSGVTAFAVLILFFALSTTSSADETDAKRLLKAMSEYLAAQSAVSFNYDASLEVVTPDDQVLGLASSGSLQLSRPDKIHVTRMGGFADVHMNFDGKTLTILGKNENLYTQVEVPGDIDHLVKQLREQYSRPLPAADLLTLDAYDALMADVIDIKDLGSGVIGGIECDWLAFRKEEVDFQIWIAQGDMPVPCKYVIASKMVANGPQYSVQFSNWKTGADADRGDYTFKNSSSATKVELNDLKGAGDLPSHFEPVNGESQ